MTPETTVSTQEMREAEMKEARRRKRNIAITAAFVIIGVLLIVWVYAKP
jgi:predicted nucleic acid-binding Zn ribbon protein